MGLETGTDADAGVETEKSPDNANRAIEGDGESILLVDDDPLVLETYRRILEKLNYKVMTASNGQESVDLYKFWQGRIDLVLIDYILPKLSGRQAIQEIQAVNPEAKIIIMTGYYGYYKLHSTDAGGMGKSRGRVLVKPFSIADLSKVIQDTLAD